jgi:tetratricopeptide (TPR) repeat protein
MRENALVQPPSPLAAMARVHLAGNRTQAARLLLRRAFELPACHELDALVEYLDAVGKLPDWRDAVGEFALSPRALNELKRALFSYFEKRGHLQPAIALIDEEPGLISPVGAFQIEDGVPARISCDRVRALARKTGGFAEASAILERLAGIGAPDAAPQLAALYADWAESGGDSAAALRHLDRAAALRPAAWEFARRATQIRLSRNEAWEAQTSIERFLGVSQSAVEREMAFDLWERAHAVGAARKPGS